MTARTVCPAVYAGLLGGALAVTPTSAYALSLKDITQKPITGNPLYDGVLWVGAGVAVGVAAGLCIHGGRKAIRKHTHKNHGKHSSMSSEDAWNEQHKSLHLNTESEKVHAYEDGDDKHVAKHSNDDVSLEQLADNYVKKEHYKQNKNIRSKGVATILAERLGFTTEDFMEGIPIIERADGTVGDVGTSWWEKAVEDKKAAEGGITEFFHINDDWSATSMLKDLEAELEASKKSEPVAHDLEEESLIYATPEPVSTFTGHDVSNGDMTSGFASENDFVYQPELIDTEFENEYYVPEEDELFVSSSEQNFNHNSDDIDLSIDLDTSPIRSMTKSEIWQMAIDTLNEKTPEESSSPKFEWNKALDAMDKNIEDDIVAHKIEMEEEQDFDVENPIWFEDVIGHEESIDDPDGLEPQTDIIHFKAPYENPEVVDTNTYINYLINSERERFRSRCVKSKSRKHLRVIEGGTSEFKVIDKNYLDDAQEA